MATIHGGNESDDHGFRLEPWYPGSTQAVITWADENGQFHETICHTDADALARLEFIHRRLGWSLLSCVLEDP